jgi:hypothetical protein
LVGDPLGVPNPDSDGRGGSTAAIPAAAVAAAIPDAAVAAATAASTDK